MYGDPRRDLEYALSFTEVYLSQGDKALREAACLRLQVPYILAPIEDDDLIAGRMDHGYVGFSPQYGGIYTYYFHDDRVAAALEALKAAGAMDAALEGAVARMRAFWAEEKTAARLARRFRERHGVDCPSSYEEPGFANCGGRLAGTTVDLGKLVRLGLPGLRDELGGYMRRHPANTFYVALSDAVESLADACRIYAGRAEPAQGASPARKAELAAMKAALEALPLRAPQTFREGLQLVWIYVVASDLMNYGRLDDHLGALWAADIDAGRMDEEEGISLILSMYRHLDRIGKVHDSRIIIGGSGRKGPKNADRLAMAFMEASRRFHRAVPQLTLRYDPADNPALLDRALRVNVEGTTFPIIYGDETNVPAVMQLYGVGKEEAERYLPFGCGEYVLEGLSTGTPNNGVNLLKALELTLRDGYDPYWGKKIIPGQGPAASFKDFESLIAAFDAAIAPEIEKLAYHKGLNYTTAAEQASYLHISLLMDDCLAKGKALLDGGVRYLNAASEVFGIISTADSLSAIKKIVYDEGRCSLPELVAALDADFEGQEKLRALCLGAPKYGNDEPEADGMAYRVFELVARRTIEAGRKTSLHRYAIVSVNNSMSATWGRYCAASPCGRKSGDPMSNGNGPSLGADKRGLSALLNSMSAFPNHLHAGVINNVRFTKSLLENNIDKIAGLLKAFFRSGGVQINPTVADAETLRAALARPEAYPDLMVRIGGFSARFVELDPTVQNEIVLRTSYGEAV